MPPVSSRPQPPSRWERTLPSLLDRLRENAAESPANGFISPRQYVKSVRRDLDWLLKTEISRVSDIWLLESTSGPDAEMRNRAAEEDPLSLADYPNASRSVLAYGVPAQRGEHGFQPAAVELARAIEQAIRVFEPRIDPKSLKVRVVPAEGGESEENSVASFCYQIEGQVRLKPLPENLLLKAWYNPAFAQWRIEGEDHG